AGRADQVTVIVVEKEIVQYILDRNPPYGEARGSAAIRNLPDLRHVLEGDDEATARRRGVDGTGARAAGAGVRDRDDLKWAEVVRVEQHQRMRQAVAGEHIAAVVRHCGVAGVDPHPDLSDVLQAVEIVLADPAIARSQVNEPPVR